MSAFAATVTVAALEDDPYPIYARLREEEPVAWVPAVGMWLATRWDEALRVASEPETFAADMPGSPLDRSFGSPTILTCDGDVHRDLRDGVDPPLRPREVDGYIDALIAPLATAALDGLGGEAELMADYFEPVSVLGLGALLGLEDLGADTLRRWFAGLAEGAVNFAGDPERQRICDAVCAEIDAALAPRLADPVEGSLLAHMLDGRPPERVMPTLKVILLGGMQEPGHGAGTTLFALLTHPDALAAVRADPDALLPAAIEEGMRWIAPIGTQGRRTVEPVELGGVTLPAHAPVAAVLASANRDASRFPDPDRFDLHRPRGRVATFGFGRHFCSGHAFARALERIALRALLDRFPRLQLAGDVPFTGWGSAPPAPSPSASAAVVPKLRLVGGDGRQRLGFRSVRALAVVVVWLAAWAATAVADSAPPAVAVVGDDPITETEYRHWFRVAARSSGAAVAPDPPRFERCIAAKRKAVMRRRRGGLRKRLERQCAAENRALLQQVMQLLTSFRWIRGEAEAQGVTVTPAEVRAQFRQQKRASFPKQKDYEAFLEESGQTDADILTRVELDLLSNRLRERVNRAVPEVSDEDVARYYDRYRERFTLPERRNLRLVKTKTKGEAAAARARIEAGERWSTVAEQLSTDRASRSRGGRLRGLAEGQLERALDRAVFASRRGALRGPIRTRSGWYVFRVTRIRPAREHSLERSRPTIVALLRSQREQEALDRFVRDFTRRWRAQTICRAGYRTSDCANGPSGAR